MSVSRPLAYQIGPYSGVPQSVLDGSVTSTLAELLAGIDRSTVAEDVVSALPVAGWRLWRTKPTARGGRQQVWFAPAGDGWVNVAITELDDGRRLLSAFSVEPDQALPSREDRREGLTLQWLTTQVELAADQVATRTFEFELRNNRSGVWRNIADDDSSVLVRVADVTGYYVYAPGTALADIAPGDAVTVSGRLQVAGGEALTPGTYVLTAHLSSLGLPTSSNAQLRIVP